MANNKVKDKNWDFSHIKHPILRAELEKIAAIPEAKLIELGLSVSIRDKWLECIFVTGAGDDSALQSCMIWTGRTVTERNGKKRAIIKYMGKVYFVARVTLILVHQAKILDGKKALHKCPGGENPMCGYSGHLYLGTDADNRLDQSKYTQVPSHPLYRLVQIIRATYDSLAPHERYGVVSALHRYIHEQNLVPVAVELSRSLVSKIVNRTAFALVPDDPSAGISRSLLAINRREDNRDVRNGSTRMPEPAARLFWQLFNSGLDKTEKKLLFDFGQKAFGLHWATLYKIGHGSRSKSVHDQPPSTPKVPLTLETLEVLFKPYTNRP